MAYDEGLAERIREHFWDRSDVQEKNMFGGLCFMVSNHMCCGIIGEQLMARVGPAHYQTCLKNEHVKEMDFTGKPMKGMVYVAPEGIESDSDLRFWIKTCTSFIASLPPKNSR